MMQKTTGQVKMKSCITNLYDKKNIEAHQRYTFKVSVLALRVIY